MPPEYCSYGPDFETHCAPWLKKHHPDLFKKYCLAEGNAAVTSTADANNDDDDDDDDIKKSPRPSAPRTIEERLVAFYEEYQPDKLDSIPGLLEKYAGKEDKLFTALTKKYGEEPRDPYYSDSDDDDEDDDDEENVGKTLEGLQVSGDKKKRRGAGAKKNTNVQEIRVVVQKRAQNKRRILTVVLGMESVPDIKLKDVSKAFSKKFAGSSSVKEGSKGSKEKEIIVQGDHCFDVAELLVDTFKVPDTAVFIDMGEGDLVPLR